MADSKYILEIATVDFVTTKSAVEGGADRIELCANLAEGGTTPSYGHIRSCREAFKVLIYPIIRPRGGDFLYSDEEFELMLLDVKMCKQLYCDGIVIGLLNSEGELDEKRVALMIDAAYPMGVTFHRAFDRCAHPFETMERLIEIGCERILTSGQKPAAPDAIDFIAELNKIADQRIIIMPGSGVRKENIKQLADGTGCFEFHSSLRSKLDSKMNYIHPSFAGDEDSYMNNAVEAQEVKNLRQALGGV